MQCTESQEANQWMKDMTRGCLDEAGSTDASGGRLFVSVLALPSPLPYTSAAMADQKAASQSFSDEETLVTKEGLKALKDELDELKNVRRKQVAEKLKEAISYGDLSENAEYEEAKNEQAFVEGRILELEGKVKNARIISEHDSKSKTKVIEIGSKVTVQNKTEKEEAETYTIVGSMEADPLNQKISNESPIGKAVLGRQKGDVVSVKAPAGEFKYEILKIV